MVKNAIKTFLLGVVDFAAIRGYRTVTSLSMKEQTLFRALRAEGTRETMDFIKENLRQAFYLSSRLDLLTAAIDEIGAEGLVLEFGVGRGESITHIASRIDGPVHGFDSFVGLPTRWGASAKAGSMCIQDGSLPSVPGNVSLHKGWFSETLPKFVEANPENVAFLHIDVDIYESTVDIFDALCDRLQQGTVIVFDDYFNYWGWQNHEHRALVEAAERYGFEYEYLGFSETQLAIKIVAPPKNTGK